MTDMTYAIRAVLVGHGVPGDGADEIAAILEEEHVGSALDVCDAVGHLLGDEPGRVQDISKALFEGLGHTRTKRARLPSLALADAGPSALDQISWKREYMSAEQRFVLPYTHALEGSTRILTLRQAPFGPEGFASTIWDSAIVLARYLEKHAPRFAGRRCVELGAGCGLPGIVLHALGAAVVLTDMDDNLPLLEHNVRTNCDDTANGGAANGAARVAALHWGCTLSDEVARDGPYDLIVATDVLYVHEAVGPLVETLVALATDSTELLLAAVRPSLMLLSHASLSRLSLSRLSHASLTHPSCHLPLSDGRPRFSPTPLSRLSRASPTRLPLTPTYTHLPHTHPLTATYTPLPLPHTHPLAAAGAQSARWGCILYRCLKALPRDDRCRFRAPPAVSISRRGGVAAALAAAACHG